MPVSSKAKKLAGFTFLGASQRRYLRWLQRNDAVDRTHYRRTHKRLPALFRAFPERHYVAFGEELGLSPRSDFAPFGYRRLNPDLVFEPSKGLLRHFLQVGQAQGRTSFDPVDPASFPPVNPPVMRGHSSAIVLHLYYLELWPDFAQVLRSLTIEYDLFVTLTFSPHEADVTKRVILEDFPGSSVTILPNHGRDVFPFVYLVNGGLLSGYDLICKMHGKRSSHRIDGDRWRVQLVEELLPAERTQELVRAFQSTNEAVVMTAGSQIRSDRSSWGTNRERVAELLARVGQTPGRAIAPFPAGSMFWAKPALIDWLQTVSLEPSDFEIELGQLDGTSAHAVERLIGYGATLCGGVVTSVDEVAIRR